MRQLMLDIDARFKTAAACILVVIALVTENLYVLGSFSLLFTMAALLARVHPATILRGALTIIPFLIASVIFGRDLESSENFLPHIISLLRILTMVLIALILAGTTNSKDLVDSLFWLMSPLRRVGVDTGRLSSILSLGIYYWPIIAEENIAFVKAGFTGKKISIRTLPGEAAAVLEGMIRISLRKMEQLPRQ